MLLGFDESGSTTQWGHATNSLMDKFTLTDSRWYCKTSGHSRVMDFKTWHPGINGHIQGGYGDASGLMTAYSVLPGHNATLPSNAPSWYTNQGDSAMTEFTFWRSWSAHWGIRGAGGRWECDDYTGGSQNSTHHQVWIR